LGRLRAQHGNPEPFIGGTIEPSAQAAVLNAPPLLARNTFGQPNHVRIEQSRLQSDSGILNYQFPAFNC
jgi:hypothetical protein